MKVGSLVRKRIKGSHWCLPNGMPRDYPVTAVGIILEHNEFDHDWYRVHWNGDYRTVWGALAHPHGNCQFWVSSFDLAVINESR